MEINLWGEATLSSATQFMFSFIDNNDFDIEHIIIVPDRFSLLAEKKLLETLSNGILFNVKVTTFSNFAKNILQENGCNRDILSASERLLVIAKAVKNCQKDFLYFKKSNINFCNKMLKTISLLQSSNVSWQELLKEEKVSTSLKNKFHDISLIYKEYLSLIQDKLDPALLLEIAFSQENIKNYLKNKIIYLAQFDSFTAQMYDSIKFFAQNCKCLNISFAKAISFDNDYIYEKDIQEKIIKISKEIGCQLNVKIGNNKRTEVQEVILKSLYCPIKNIVNYNNYKSFSAFNKSQEVEGVAKIIADQIRKGCKFNDFEIAVGDIENYKALIDEIFSKFDFPYFVDTSITADQTIFARTILQLLDVRNSNLSKESLLNFFNNPLIKIWTNNQEIIEKIIRNDIDGRWKFQKSFSFNDACSQYIYKMLKVTTNEEKNNLINNFIEDLKIFHEKYLTLLNDNMFFKEKNIEMQVESVIEESLKLIEDNENKFENCDFKEFAKKLVLVLQSREISSVPTLADGIMIGDATESFFENKKFLFVVGGQNLPKIIGDNSLLSDSDISNPIYEKTVEPTSRMINRRNRFALFNLLGEAKENIIVSFLQFDEDGRSNTIPLFIEQLNEIFHFDTIKMNNFFALKKQDNEEDFVFKIGCKNNLTKLIVENNSNKVFNNYFDLKNLQDKNFIKNMMFKNKKVSVSQLESYFSCPFKHYARYGLSLKEQETLIFDQRDVGNLCHKVVELFVKGYIDGKNNFEYGTVDSFIQKNFDKIIEEEGIKSKLEIIPEQKGLENFLKFQVKTILSNVLLELEKTLFIPRCVEQKVENNSIFDDLNFVGKIDRIDAANGFFRIIDYKTGKVGSLIKDLYYGDKVQLFLYGKIVAKKFKEICGGVFYFNCKFEYDDLEKGKSLLKGIAENDDENLKLFDKDLPIKMKSSILQLSLSTAKKKTKNYIGRAIAKRSLNFYCEYAEKVARKAYEEIKEGFILPKPDESSCDGCKYSSLCLYCKTFGERTKKFSEKIFKEDK